MVTQLNLGEKVKKVHPSSRQKWKIDYTILRLDTTNMLTMMISYIQHIGHNVIL